MNINRTTPPYQIKATVSREYYGALDGLRAYAAIGIVMMHVLANLQIKPSVNYITDTIIPFFSNFVFLFMMISAFGLGCGYYDRIKNNRVTPNAFYTKRYKRILPFFVIMVIIDLVWEHNLRSLLEGFADITLCFGLYPNANITVIGVGWFLGTIFVFYMLYPFFVFLMDSKRRAWITLVISVALALIGIYYFGTKKYFEEPMEFGRSNILYSAPFFVIGGIVYLYRHELSEFVIHYRILSLLATGFLIISTFACLSYVPMILSSIIIFTALLVYSLGSKDFILNNPIVKYLSKISMEIYLCHMLFFRIVGLVHLENHTANPNLLYIITSACTLIGAICFSHICKFHIINKIKWLK